MFRLLDNLLHFQPVRQGGTHSPRLPIFRCPSMEAEVLWIVTMLKAVVDVAKNCFRR
jgi:hypothetical protein